MEEIDDSKMPVLVKQAQQPLSWSTAHLQRCIGDLQHGQKGAASSADNSGAAEGSEKSDDGSVLGARSYDVTLNDWQKARLEHFQASVMSSAEALHRRWRAAQEALQDALSSLSPPKMRHAFALAQQLPVTPTQAVSLYELYVALEILFSQAFQVRKQFCHLLLFYCLGASVWVLVIAPP